MGERDPLRSPVLVSHWNGSSSLALCSRTSAEGFFTFMTRKQLTLSSGATCWIRKVCAQDYIAHGNADIPTLFADAALVKARAQKNELTPKEIQSLLRMTRIVLLCCVSPLQFLPPGSASVPAGSASVPASTEIIPPPAPRKIVDKPFWDRAENEITIEELDPEDAQKIVEEIAILSRMTKEAALAARPFPAEQETPGSTAPSSEAVRPAPDGAAEPAA